MCSNLIFGRIESPEPGTEPSPRCRWYSCSRNILAIDLRAQCSINCTQFQSRHTDREGKVMVYRTVLLTKCSYYVPPVLW